MRFLLVSLALLGALLASFVPAAAQADTGLAGSGWKLVSINGTDVLEGSSITLEFGADGSLSGSGGCNGYGGSFTIDGDSFSVSGVMSTLMACADDAVTAQEAAYFAALQAATGYSVSGEELIISDAEGMQLVFSRLATLTRASWKLVAYGTVDAPTAVIEGSSITLTFDKDGRISGSAGCNTYGAGYSTEGSTLQISAAMSTMMACLQEGVMEQESAFLLALQAATSYRLDGSSLFINYEEGKQLVFVEITPLTANSWQLVSFGPMDAPLPVVDGSLITLNFGTEGRASGSGGCNTYGAPYTVDGSSLTFGPAFSTKRACAESSVMGQEAAYFAALEKSERYVITGEQLFISTSDGQLLVFNRPGTVTVDAAEETVSNVVDYSSIPQSRTEDGAFVLGNPEAVLTIVEFADFTCPHCQTYHEDIRRFISTYVATGQAKFEYRMMRATGNPYGDLAAHLAECAETVLPGSYWMAYDHLYALSAAGLSDTLTDEVAVLLDVQPAALTECAATASQLMTDSLVARAAGVTGTPAVMVRVNNGPLQWIRVGGQVLNGGGVPFEILEQIVATVQASSGS